MKAYKHLVKHALANKLTVSVYDGGVWEVKDSVSYQDIINCIESVSESEIVLRDSFKARAGWALIVLEPDQEYDECVADHTDNDFMSDWWNVYTIPNKEAYTTKYLTFDTSICAKDYI